MKIYWSNNENLVNVFLQSLQLLTDDWFLYMCVYIYIFISQEIYIYIYQKYKNTKKFQVDMLLFLLFMS